MKKILVGYDASPAAERALQRTAELARAFGAEVTVVSVAPIYHGWGRGIGTVDPVDPPERHEAELSQAKQKLAELGVTAETIDGLGEPARMIAEIAEEESADLIVLGTRDLGTVGRLLRGSVSADVAHRAHRDLLIVH